MGGREGSRGYTYQGIVAVLEAFTDISWDKIFVELATEEDKVDIALSQKGKIVRTIQVKSTDNTFSQGEVKKWIQDLAKDYPCENYELVLIGQCAKNTLTFIKSIEKYKNQKEDKIAKAALADFDTSILDQATLKVRVLSNDVDSLLANLMASILKYLEAEDSPISYMQLDFVAKAMITDQLLQSIHGNATERQQFDLELKTRINLFKQQYGTQRIPVCVQSFSRGTERIVEKATAVCDLQKFFNGRKLISGVSWTNDVLPIVESFFEETTDQEHAYKIYLEAHSSIAFAAGRCCHSKMGIDILPMQKDYDGAIKVWGENINTSREYPEWLVRDERISHDCFDTALILNLTHDIDADVERFISETKLPIGRIMSCKLDGGGANYLVQDGSHAFRLASSIGTILSNRTTTERRKTLHVFASAPNAFMFFLGRNSVGFGKCKLYEYDFELRDSCSYVEAINYL